MHRSSSNGSLVLRWTASAALEPNGNAGETQSDTSQDGLDDSLQTITSANCDQDGYVQTTITLTSDAQLGWTKNNRKRKRGHDKYDFPISIPQSLARREILTVRRRITPKLSQHSFASTSFRLCSPVDSAVPILALKFSSSALFGHLLLTADESGVLKLIDSRVDDSSNGIEIDCYLQSTAAGSSVVASWCAHTDAVFDVCWADNDTKILTGAGDYTVRIFDSETQRSTHQFVGHKGSVKSVCLQNSNPHVFASASRDGQVKVWDIRQSGSRAAAELQPDASDSDAILCTKSDLTIANAHSLHNTLRSANSLPTVSRSTKRPKKKRRMARTACSTSALPPLCDASSTMHNSTSALSAMHNATSPTAATQQSVTGVLYSRDDHVLITAGAVDGQIKYWDTRQCRRRNQSALAAFPAFDIGTRRHGIASLALDHTGTRLVASCLDNHVYVYDYFDPLKGAVDAIDVTINSFYVKSVFVSDGRYVVSGSSSRKVYVWDMQHSGTASLVAALRGHHGEVLAVDWCHADFGKFASSSDDGTVRVWRLQRRSGGEETAENNAVLSSSQEETSTVYVNPHLRNRARGLERGQRTISQYFQKLIGAE